MKIQFASKFSKDLRKIKDQKLLSEIKLVVNQCKLVQTLDDIKSLKKLKVYQDFYLIKIGDYRIDVAIINDELMSSVLDLMSSFTVSYVKKYYNLDFMLDFLRE